MLWAVCELLKEGSAKAQLQEHFPDPIAYRDIEQQGQEMLGRLQSH